MTSSGAWSLLTWCYQQVVATSEDCLVIQSFAGEYWGKILNRLWDVIL
jgi:hypothetical protein